MKRQPRLLSKPIGLNPEGGVFDPWGKFVDDFTYMVREARNARQEEGHSYRGFHVGAVILAASADYQTLAYFRGANVKRAGKQKVCAEKIALGKAENHGLTNIIAIVVSGPKQQDHGSGIETPTLHCCEACRQQLEEEVNGDVLIATVLPNKDQYQLQTGRELITFHNQVAQGEMPTTDAPLISDHQFHRWEQSRPMYRQLTEGLEPFINDEHRSQAIAAARVAITGFRIAAA